MCITCTKSEVTEEEMGVFQTCWKDEVDKR